MLQQNKGFTLIEIMIAVLIVAILAAVAIPSYTQYVHKARRTEATSALLQIAAGMERFVLRNNQYPTDLDTLVNGTGGFNAVPVGGIQESGSAWLSENNHYSFVIGTDATNGRYVRASAYSSAAAGDKDCKSFNYFLSGLKTAFDASSVSSTDKCWAK